MNIHLIDRSSEDLLFLFDFLTNAGFQVEASSAAAEGLDRIARSHPALLFCEFEMPELNGLEILERVKRISPQTRVVLMSPSDGWLQHDEVLRRGGQNLLLKPFGRRDVQRVLERASTLQAPRETAGSRDDR